MQKARQLSPAIHGSRRPKKGLRKQITFWVSEEEKRRIEQAATTAGLSMSRFVREKALKAAKEVLSQQLMGPALESRPSSVILKA